MSRPLTEADKQVFYRLRISTRLIERAGIVRVTSDESQTEFGARLDSEGGIAFPYFTLPNGLPRQRLTARIRQDPPGDAVRKYVSPFGDVRHLYFAPVNEMWAEDKSTPAMIVEAEKSALAITRWAEDHDYPLIVIALGGCWNWRGRIGKTVDENGARIDEKGPLPDLEICRGRCTYLLFDANVHPLSAEYRPSVHKAREELIKTLQEINADPRVLELPPQPKNSPINGPDDYLAGFSDAVFFELFENVKRREAATAIEIYDSREEFENTPEPTFSISGFLQDYSVTAIAGLSGHGKTWVTLALIRALLFGPGKLWELFGVTSRAEKVIYLIPEASRSTFKQRLKVMGLYEEIGERLFVRTLTKGPALPLTDATLLRDVKHAHLVCDTAIRFMQATDENSASEAAKGLSEDFFAIQRAEARTILALFHSPKSFSGQNSMSLENMIRGSSEFGAMLSSAWGIKQIDAVTNSIHVENLKSRDFSPCHPFELIGRPYIDETGDFRLLNRECDRLEALQRSNEQRAVSKDKNVNTRRRVVRQRPQYHQPGNRRAIRRTQHRHYGGHRLQV